MTDNSMLTPPGGSASPYSRPTRPGLRGRALLAAVLILASSVVIGLAGGAIWAAAAPRVVYLVQTLSPPTAYATNPETSAFIAADGWYCLIALVGGALIGLLGYLIGVRRYGPGPMAAVVVGSVAAAFIAAWLGHQLSGASGFDHVLATSRPGTLLRAPISLGAHGALGFWPLAAAAVAGGIELVGVLRARHQAPYGGMPMPGMESFDTRPFPAHRYPPQRYPGQSGPGQTNSGQPSPGQASSGQASSGQPTSGQDPATFGQDAPGAGGQAQQDSEPGQGGR
jgi:hypothetical protein